MVRFVLVAFVSHANKKLRPKIFSSYPQERMRAFSMDAPMDVFNAM